MSQNPICPCCLGESTLVKGDIVYPHRKDLKELNFWYCAEDHQPAYVGCHTGGEGTTPLGRLADSTLRKWKRLAHKAFDPFWREGELKRKDAYKWLSQRLGMPTKECHIGMMNIEECKRVVEVCK